MEDVHQDDEGQVPEGATWGVLILHPTCFECKQLVEWM